METQPTRTALVTGASSGIGAAFARQLAAQGYQLILVARRKERLATLVSQLKQQYHILAEPLVADLSDAAAVEHVEKRIAELHSLEMLINNAGFGTWDKFAESDLCPQLQMIQVHIIATMRLCRAALPGMIARGSGSIINVSSIGAFLPARRNVTYNATKAYLVFFSESLQAELKGTGIQIQALCPGFTYTEFHDSPEYTRFNRSQVPQWLWSSAEEVAAASLNALSRGKVVLVPGFKNRFLLAVARNSITAPLLRAASEPVLKDNKDVKAETAGEKTIFSNPILTTWEERSD